MAIKHAKTSALPDDADPTLVLPSDWNAAHTVDAGTLTLAMLEAAATDAAAATGSLRTLGTGAQQAAAGNDSRLSDSRTPTAHEATHLSNGSDPIAAASTTVRGTVTTTTATSQVASTDDTRLSDARAPSGGASGDLTGSYPNPTVAALAITDGKVATANKDGLAGTASMRTLGTGATQAVAGNDSRLSDSRTPLAHHVSHQNGGADALDLTGLTGLLATAQTPAAHNTSHQTGGSDEISLTSLTGQVAELQGYGSYVRDYIDIGEPGTWEIPAIGFLEIDETNGPNALLCASIRVHPSSDQCLPETSSFQVLDYYDITEPYALDIPATALMEIDETTGVRDFDIS